MTEEKKSSTVPILIAIILVLIGVIGYLLFNNSKKDDTIATQEDKIEADSATITSKVKELEELSLALNRAKMEVEELGQNSDSLTSRIGELGKYIEQIKREGKANSSVLNAKIAEFKKLLDLKDQEIAGLKAKTDSLSTEVSTLSKDKSQLNDSLTSLGAVKNELAQQVAIASILKAENIKVTVITKKDKELDKDEYKAKDISKLKISFTLADNKVARKENKQFVFRLIEPSGSVLYDAATGGGFFNVDGKEIPFTDKKSVKFDNTKQTVGFVYVKGSEYKSGTYTVEVYGDGNKIGETKLTVK